MQFSWSFCVLCCINTNGRILYFIPSKNSRCGPLNNISRHFNISLSFYTRRSHYLDAFLEDPSSCSAKISRPNCSVETLVTSAITPGHQRSPISLTSIPLTVWVRGSCKESPCAHVHILFPSQTSKVRISFIV